MSICCCCCFWAFCFWHYLITLKQLLQILDLFCIVTQMSWKNEINIIIIIMNNEIDFFRKITEIKIMFWRWHNTVITTIYLLKDMNCCTVILYLLLAITALFLFLCAGSYWKTNCLICSLCLWIICNWEGV